ncbi:uncharacterized protein LOC111676038 [Lucilia cuprina]|uniref:uncharacterized protein LOC111676038 n=1 Tax=Lucilia cuprina TaxID=7375 RepID=UPI001F05B4B6|nr:uncharacterized protein LOC111676038 [Lucilia cuprina]
MRFYPNGDISNYWELPSNWSLYSHNPNTTWQRKPLQHKHTIAYWCDLEGGKMSEIKKKDLYLKNFSNTRIRGEACLPWYYCVGNRFIRLEKAFPHDFKCTVLPMNLQEVRAVNEYERETAKNAKAGAAEAKRLAEEAAKLEMKKKGIRS